MGGGDSGAKHDIERTAGCSAPTGGDDAGLCSRPVARRPASPRKAVSMRQGGNTMRLLLFLIGLLASVACAQPEADAEIRQLQSQIFAIQQEQQTLFQQFQMLQGL